MAMVALQDSGEIFLPPRIAAGCAPGGATANESDRAERTSIRSCHAATARLAAWFDPIPREMTDAYQQPSASTGFRSPRHCRPAASAERLARQAGDAELFRDAACPFCNLRVYELSNEYAALQAHGLEVVVFFRSGSEEVQRFIARRPRPFRLVADPQMAVYGPYGIERSMLGTLRAMMRRLPRLMQGLRLGQSRLPAGDPSLMPADFLIDERGRVRRAYYGRDLGDHLPLVEVQTFAARR